MGEVLGKLASGDMGDDAEVRVGGLEEIGPIAGGKVETIPGTAEQRGELAGALAEHMENGSKFLGEEEEAAIGGGFLIAQSAGDAVGGGAGGGDAARDPEGVYFGEEAGDLTPAGSFTGFAGFADQDDEEVEAVTGGTDGAVRRGAEVIGRIGGRRPMGGLPGKQLPAALFDGGERGDGSAEGVVCRCHDSALVRFVVLR